MFADLKFVLSPPGVGLLAGRLPRRWRAVVEFGGGKISVVAGEDYACWPQKLLGNPHDYGAYEVGYVSDGPTVVESGVSPEVLDSLLGRLAGGETFESAREALGLRFQS